MAQVVSFIVVNFQMILQSKFWLETFGALCALIAGFNMLLHMVVESRSVVECHFTMVTKHVRFSMRQTMFFQMNFEMSFKIERVGTFWALIFHSLVYPMDFAQVCYQYSFGLEGFLTFITVKFRIIPMDNPVSYHFYVRIIKLWTLWRTFWAHKILFRAFLVQF